MKSIVTKCLFLLTLTLGIGSGNSLLAQDAGDFFNRAAKQYVNADKASTEQTLAEGLNRFPNDTRMRALLEKLRKEEEEQQQQQQQQDQQNGDQDPKDPSQDQKQGEGDEQTQDDPDVDSEKSEEKRGEKSQQEQPTEQPTDQESDLSEREKQMQQMREKLQDMNITPQQAAQILDAMNNAELRHIQQNKRKPTKRPDRSLPEW